MVKSESQDMVEQTTQPKAYSTKDVAAGRNQIPRPEIARNWPHLNIISDTPMEYNPDVDIGLLIDLDCTAALKAQHHIADDVESHPYACKTKFGWGIIGGAPAPTKGIVKTFIPKPKRSPRIPICNPKPGSKPDSLGQNGPRKLPMLSERLVVVACKCRHPGPTNSGDNR
ncbi:hypothetical protein E2C01_050501 [Portunus trituberculatus]|uniref:Uncharacterized protein n=1 Tax=Portunus trituberculatus TaxID=210409 RepID=A0A5B7GGA9_PORTR|nr:hypothetical protein [Portunus trituberculatus]